jgi:hypothetical protein
MFLVATPATQRHCALTSPHGRTRGMAGVTNPHEVLGLQPSATKEQVCVCL